MKRWDLTTVCANLGASHDGHMKKVMRHLKSVMTHPAVRADKELKESCMEVLDNVNGAAEAGRLMHEVSTNQYPIYGLKAWMMEGGHPAIHHAFARADERELMMLALISKLETQLAEFRAQEPLHDADWPAMAALAGQLSESFPAKTKQMFNAIVFIYNLDSALADLRRLFMGVDLYKIDWLERHGVAPEDMSDDLYVKMQRYHGRLKMPEPAPQPAAKPPAERAEPEMTAEQRRTEALRQKRFEREAVKAAKKKAREDAKAMAAAGNVVKLRP